MKIRILVSMLLLLSGSVLAQDKGLVNTSESPYAKVNCVGINDTKWTDGFWAERAEICNQNMVPHMMGCYMDADISHSFRNFEIAAGLCDGEHVGPAFHDGDFYKMLEAEIMVYASTGNKNIEKEIDRKIEVLAKAQRKDGYIHTPTSIKDMKEPDKKHEFAERLDFETYNMGHLMTAACVHYRLTGKRNLLDIAIGATDFLYNFYKTASTELARNAICPSHYMGTVEMYRTTRDPKYLELAINLIEIRSLMKNGTDDNQDRTPFKQQTEAMGHSVRANYLYAGAADVYAETGDDSLLIVLNKMWEDVTQHKMYITGACGALYNGVSPDGTTYDQSPIQQVHQAYGRQYQLPNITAHNETCANIGNMLWNWRMFLITGEAKYVDIVELVMYNSLLSGVSLDGKAYFYTNPLCVVHGVSEKYRWSKVREPYISFCNCCPPNTIRTIAQSNSYAYSVSDKGLWVNIYGSNELKTKLNDGTEIELAQTTGYPWNGNISIEMKKVSDKPFSLFLRIPGWATETSVKVNGEVISDKCESSSYVEINRKWKNSDKVELSISIKPVMIQANPLLEEARGQVAVKLGPVVYCLEGVDVPEGSDVFDVTLPINMKLEQEPLSIGTSKVVALKGEALLNNNSDWKGALYAPVDASRKTVSVRLVPYYAWGNREKSNMTVWMPVN